MLRCKNAVDKIFKTRIRPGLSQCTNSDDNQSSEAIQHSPRISRPHQETFKSSSVSDLCTSWAEEV
eukprot:787895-Amphidinium_carterae.1